MDLESWTTIRTLPGAIPTEPIDHPRSERLGKVFVTPETKALLAVIGERIGIGASGVAALLVEELRHQGQINQVWKAHQNRRRRAKYQTRYGAREAVKPETAEQKD
jgi:hypothetical protein